MGAVFISYRRGDVDGQARALVGDLSNHIGRDNVFIDVDSIAPGRDFRQVLKERLETCDMVLALIGGQWLDAKDQAGRRRLEDPGDFVRQEVAAALKRDIPVTPILLEDADMPTADRLPDEIKDLAYRNAFTLSHARWESDVEELIRRLGLARVAPSPVALPTATPRSRMGLFVAAAAAVVVAGILLSQLGGLFGGEQVPVALSAPAQISPPDNAVLEHYPRRTTLVWRALDGAQSYTVEHTFLDTNETCEMEHDDTTLVPSLSEPTFTYDFVGAQPGCWRVWAVDQSGVEGMMSPWWRFEYQQ
jgi:hypothetical protein